MNPPGNVPGRVLEGVGKVHEALEAPPRACHDLMQVDVVGKTPQRGKRPFVGRRDVKPGRDLNLRNANASALECRQATARLFELDGGMAGIQAHAQVALEPLGRAMPGDPALPSNGIHCRPTMQMLVEKAYGVRSRLQKACGLGLEGQGDVGALSLA